MSDFEMISVFLMILSLVVVLLKKDNIRKPPCSFRPARRTQVLPAGETAEGTATFLPTLYAICPRLSRQARAVFLLLFQSNFDTMTV